MNNSKILLLTGASLKSKQWSENLLRSLQKVGYSVTLFSYCHWDTQDEEIDIQHESERLRNVLINTKNLTVIAKSAGSLVFTKALKDSPIKISRAVFIGFPLEYAIEKRIDFSETISSYTVKTLCIQEDQDPMGSFETVNQLFSTNKNIIMRHIDGNDHQYTNIDKVIVAINTFLQSSSLRKGINKIKPVAKHL